MEVIKIDLLWLVGAVKVVSLLPTIISYSDTLKIPTG